MKDIPSNVIGYVASALDCEGCIDIIEYKNLSNNPSFSLKVCIGNDSLRFINYITVWFGGGKYQHTRANGKTQYSISWCASKAQELLTQLLPYLIVKKDLAKLAISFQEVVNLKGNRKSLTREEIDLRRLFVRFVKLSRKITT